MSESFKRATYNLPRDSVSSGRKYDVAVLTTVFNTKDLLRQFLTSVHDQNTSLSVLTMVTDNGSDDGVAQMVAEDFPWVQFFRNEKNIGQIKALNSMTSLVKSKYFLFCHADVVLDNNVIDGLVSFLLDNPKIAIASPLHIYPDGNPYIVRTRFPTIGSELKSAISAVLKTFTGKTLIKDGRLSYIRTGPVEFVRSAAVIVRSEIFREVGGFNNNLFSWKHVHDLCWKVKKAGYEVWYYSGVRLIHYEVQTPKAMSQGAKYKQDFSIAKPLVTRDQFIFYRNHFSVSQICVFRFCQCVRNCSFATRSRLSKLIKYHYRVDST